MDIQLQKEYIDITELLEREIDKYDNKILVNLISSLNGIDLEFDNNDCEETEDIQRALTIFSLSFTVLRVLVNCRLISKGICEYQDQLSEDIGTIIDDVKQVEYAWEVDEKILADVIDVLDLLCSDYKLIIMDKFPGERSLFRKEQGPVPADLFYIATKVIKCFLEYNYADSAATVAVNLCQMSESRNDRSRHIDLLTSVIPIIIDNCPEEAYQICNTHGWYFENDQSIVAGDFYWFFSNASYRLDKQEQANTLLKKCINVRKKILGSNNWYTALAECEYMLQNMVSNRDKEFRTFLLKFIDQVETRAFDDLDWDYATTVEGRVVFVLLDNEPDMESLEQYGYYVDLFEQLCRRNITYTSPVLNDRIAWNIRGTYCFRTGDYIGAERCFKEALSHNAEVDISGQVLSDAKIKSNLLMAYQIQNDFEKALPLVAELMDLISDNQNTGLSPEDIYRIYNSYVSLLAFIDVEDEELDEILLMVKEECEDITDPRKNLSEQDKEQASFIASVIAVLLQLGWISREDHWKFYNALNRIKQNCNELQFEKRRIAVLNITLSILAFDLNLSTTGHYINEILEGIEHYGIPANMKVSAYFMSGTYYAREQMQAKAKEYLTLARNELKEAWHSSVRYLNDTRLMNTLIVSQLQFASIYAVERQLLSTEECYNNLLQFKLLASLSGRERNRIISAGIADPHLMSEINQKQDQLASLESESSWNVDEKEIEKVTTELRELEIQFALQVPSSFGFVNISLDNVMQRMPDNSVVIEYFNTVPYYGISTLEQGYEEQCIDVYVLRKENGRCVLGKKIIDYGEKVLADAEDLTLIYSALSRNKASSEQQSNFETIKRNLYKALIAPVIGEMGSVDTVYIAPCDALTNIPFGLLEDDYSERLQDHYKIMKIECARDFLFEMNHGVSNGKNLVMGDPEYDINERVKKISLDKDRPRSIKLLNPKIEELPFSGIEALRIKMKVGADCCIGINATKKKLLSGEKYRNIHIATHGWIDFEGDTDTLYSSCLFLAGAQNWLDNNQENDELGNGIVTADEVSRQNWDGVNLVVLSSCMSGMNDYTINKGFNGMISALSAAGVKYVISSLWSQDDLGTAVMMEEFYRLYILEKKSPIEALAGAQLFLSEVTIGELRARGWLKSVDYRTDAIIGQYNTLSDRRRPFRNEIFWGGFECYQCN